LKFLRLGQTRAHHNKPVTQPETITPPQFWLVSGPANKEGSVYFASRGESTAVSVLPHEAKALFGHYTCT